MKVLRWILFIVGLIFLLLMAIITPFAWLGLLIYLFGTYQMRQKGRGKVTFSRPGWIVTAGLLFSLIMAIFVAPAEETRVTKIDEKVKNAEIEKEQQDEQKEKAEEEQEAKEAAEKAKKEDAARQQQELVKNLNLEAVIVGRVIDGDTIELEDGRKVRLVGVNTPESTTRTEEYGKEASQYTKSKLDGAKVWLQKDVSETDRYQRLLRIVWLAIPTDLMNEDEIRKKMFNADLVLKGYAEPSTYPPDVKYSDYFVEFAREAREKNTGLWAYGENGTTKGDLDPKEVLTKKESNTDKSSQPKPAPTPAPKPAPSAPKESFKNCTELRKVYPIGVASDHPAYDPKHDRDKDNYACER